MMQKTTRKLPDSIVGHGYLKMPEWLIYYLKPNSLNVLRAIMKTRKYEDRIPYSDITNNQLAEVCGISLSYVQQIVKRLAERRYIRKWMYYETHEKRRRKIYIKNMRKMMMEKTGGKPFWEFLETKRFNESKRIEWKKINSSNWIEWIPMPHSISDPYEMKVIGVLLGQYLRGSDEIRLSNRQIALMCKIDRETVAECIQNLQENKFIFVKEVNKRNRMIEII